MSIRLPRETLVNINEALSEQMGLRFPESRFRDLERGLGIACEELELQDADQCLRALRGEKLTRHQIELLASHLTIGETYFFREPKSFGVLEQDILPELIERRRRSNRILRVWSAGCSSGEEVYSIAILLRRLIPDWKDWGITILGTDINPAALRKAESGVYGNWSFRGLGPDFKERHFTPVEPKRFRVKDEVRRNVRFGYLNLAEDTSYPSLATNTLAVDIIFCRNVLMYFSPATIKSVTRRFLSALVEGGWVITSPSEASRQYFPGFETVNFPGVILFRKPRAGKGPPVHREPLPIPSSVSAPSPLPTPRAEGPPKRRTPLPERTATEPREDPELLAEARELLARGENDEVLRRLADAPGSVAALELAARAWANQGNLTKALAVIERALAADPLAVAMHYLKAGILQEMGDSSEAAAILRKAIFLERDFVMAHFTLANIYRQLGKSAESRRHFRQTEKLLADYPADKIPPEGEGMNGRRLREIVAANLRSLD